MILHPNRRPDVWKPRAGCSSGPTSGACREGGPRRGRGGCLFHSFSTKDLWELWKALCLICDLWAAVKPPRFFVQVAPSRPATLKRNWSWRAIGAARPGEHRTTPCGVDSSSARMSKMRETKRKALKTSAPG